MSLDKKSVPLKFLWLGVKSWPKEICLSPGWEFKYEGIYLNKPRLIGEINIRAVIAEREYIRLKIKAPR